MLTAEQKLYYEKCIHEYNRAVFFGNVPNYAKMMGEEINRLEAKSPDYAAVPDKELDDFSKVIPYGVKVGSPVSEKVVDKRTGITTRKVEAVAIEP